MVLLALATSMFSYLGVAIQGFLTNWVGLFGALGIAIVAAYLVDKKKGMIESIAPVLARILTPLFLAVLVGIIAAMAVTGGAPGADRDLLITFDLALALFLGLVLYTMSARDVGQPAGWWDGVVLALVVAALVADGVALAGILDRVLGGGLTPNRGAALGENVLLLLNLTLLAIGYTRFVSGRGTYQGIVSVQMRFLPVHAVWAAVVAFVFPLLFGFA